MDYQPVESSQIAEVGYGEGVYGPETLGVRFKPFKGQTALSEYHYGNVTPEMHAAFLAAESIGKFFHARIKTHPELHPFTKIEEPLAA